MVALDQPSMVRVLESLQFQCKLCFQLGQGDAVQEIVDLFEDDL